MFVKLAIRNVHRQIQSYLIYFVTVAFSIALLFAVNNLSYSDRMQTLSKMSTDIRSMFTMVTVLSCLVTALLCLSAWGWDWSYFRCWRIYLLLYWRFPFRFLLIPYKGLF